MSMVQALRCDREICGQLSKATDRAEDWLGVLVRVGATDFQRYENLCPACLKELQTLLRSYNTPTNGEKGSVK